MSFLKRQTMLAVNNRSSRDFQKSQRWHYGRTDYFFCRKYCIYRTRRTAYKGFSFTLPLHSENFGAGQGAFRKNNRAWCGHLGSLCACILRFVRYITFDTKSSFFKRWRDDFDCGRNWRSRTDASRRTKIY